MTTTPLLLHLQMLLFLMHMQLMVLKTAADRHQGLLLLLLLYDDDDDDDDGVRMALQCHHAGPEPKRS